MSNTVSDIAAPVLIFGNGAMARVIYSFIRETSDVIGFTVDDDCIDDGQTSFCERPLYPFSQIEQHIEPESCNVIVTVGYRDMNALKFQKISELEARSYNIVGYQHPDLIRHYDVDIHPTAIILDQVSIHTGSRIGPHAFLTSQVNLGHDCIIEEGVWINGGVSVGGGTKIGKRSVINIGANIVHGITIGESAFIAANTLVANSIEDDQVVLSPAGQTHRLSSRTFMKFAKLQG